MEIVYALFGVLIFWLIFRFFSKLHDKIFEKKIRERKALTVRYKINNDNWIASFKKIKQEQEAKNEDVDEKRKYIEHYLKINNIEKYSNEYKKLTNDYVVNGVLVNWERNINKLEDTYKRVKDHECRRIAQEKRKESKRLQEIENEKQRIKASTAGKLIEKSIQKLDAFTSKSEGVYLIVNNKTLDFYIGESQNITVRRKTHIADLVENNHHSKLMQEHYNRYGNDVFDFYVLEVKRMDNENTRKYAEEMWIKEYHPTYNAMY